MGQCWKESFFSFFLHFFLQQFHSLSPERACVWVKFVAFWGQKFSRSKVTAFSSNRRCCWFCKGETYPTDSIVFGRVTARAAAIFKVFCFDFRVACARSLLLWQVWQFSDRACRFVVFFFLLEDELMSCLLNRLSLECLDNNWFFKMFDRFGHHLTDFSWACKNVKSASPKITEIPVKFSKFHEMRQIKRMQ